MIKRLYAGCLGAFLLLFVLTTFVPSAQAEARAAAYFSADEIATGLRYSFERRLLFWAATGLELALLGYLVAGGAGRRWADRFQGLARGSWLGTLLLMAAAYWLAHEALQFPVALGRHYHLRVWEMTRRSVGDWLVEYAGYTLILAVVQLVVVVGLYVLMRRYPRRWWLPATGGATVIAVGIAWLWPVFVAPLFNTFTPLRDTQWAALEPRVTRLVQKAGVPVSDILVMDASRQSSHTNAYFAGFGATRRIVLYDTLLQTQNADEIESILAHEIGHWRHDHIVKGIVLGALAALAGLWVLARILLAVVGKPPLFLSGPSDPAGLPLIVLLFMVGSWLAMPAENFVSRYFERQADEASLELAGMPDVFIAAEKRLARANKGNVAPPPWTVWLFSTHPTTVERIRMAEAWEQQAR
jgi:STE24 endopeptidase